jgi:hypothetical protein
MPSYGFERESLLRLSVGTSIPTASLTGKCIQLEGESQSEKIQLRVGDEGDCSPPRLTPNESGEVAFRQTAKTLAYSDFRC